MMTNSKYLVSGMILLTILITACDQSEQASPDIGTPKGEGRGKTIPQNPQPDSVQVTENTRKTYQWYCTQCHGINGKGNGVNARFLTVPPRNHTKAQYLETRTDEQLFSAIKFGGLSVGRAPCMPAWGQTLNDETIHSLVQYIRELCHCEAL
jgi:cytochrome c oxidase cbb3-type subunit III